VSTYARRPHYLRPNQTSRPTDFQLDCTGSAAIRDAPTHGRTRPVTRDGVRRSRRLTPRSALCAWRIPRDSSARPSKRSPRRQRRPRLPAPGSVSARHRKSGAVRQRRQHREPPLRLLREHRFVDGHMGTLPRPSSFGSAWN